MVCMSTYPLCAINKLIDKGKIVRRIEWKILGIHSIISNMQEANNSLSFFFHTDKHTSVLIVSIIFANDNIYDAQFVP